MIQQKFILIAILMMTFMLNACDQVEKTEKGACENNLDYQSSSSVFSCWENTDKDVCRFDKGQDIWHFHKNTACASIGYDYQVNGVGSSSIWWYKNSADMIGDPSPQGWFANGVPN